jgi:PIN domain nuclease of toxin-antitoxin system
VQVLLDTHTLIWADLAPDRLGSAARELLERPQTRVWVSAISAWEIGIKFAQGKLPELATLVANYHQRLARYGFIELALSSADALCAAAIESNHKDPFDRALAAQAVQRQCAILSIDACFDAMGVVRIW